MNFEKELKKRNISIRTCSIKSGIPYATLYPIIKEQVDIETCTYSTVARLASYLGYRPDEIVYKKEDFQTFRNNLHHRIINNEMEVILEIIENDEISAYARHEDYLKALYLPQVYKIYCQKVLKDHLPLKFLLRFLHLFHLQQQEEQQQKVLALNSHF